MVGEAVTPPGSGGTSASDATATATAGVEDVSKLLPLSLLRSQLVPPAPSRRRSAIDFLFDFGGSSWIAYGASSLLVISHFPSPLPQHESLIGPFFRQVIEPSSCLAAVNAVSWCPARPSEGVVAAAQGNSILFYSPHLENDSGLFCWGQTSGIKQSFMVEAIEWTGSGDGLITAGMEVVSWRRKGSSWEMTWKSVADVPQLLVSATWSAEGPAATAACFLLASGEMDAQNLPTLSKEDGKHVSVYQSDGKSEIMKFQLYHPQSISMIRWRPYPSMKSINDAIHSWRDVLLTCCLDGTVRLWSEIDNGRSKKVSKEIVDHKTGRPFQVVAVIEIEQCLKGTLGTNVFIDWAVDLASVISKSEGDSYSLSSASSKHDHIASCDWLVSVGPLNLVTLWVIHCLDDTATFRTPRATLWKKQNSEDFHACNFSNCEYLHPEEKPILVKVVSLRAQLFGPPVACSLLQLLPDNSMSWWHFDNPSMDDAGHKSLTQVTKEKILSHFSAGSLNLDGHTSNILQLTLHPYFHELELAVSLDSNGTLLFWSLSTNYNCTLGMQMFINPMWKLLHKIRSQDLSTDLKYITLAWAPLVLDEKPLLLLGHADGIDCFLIEVSHEEENILCRKIFTVSYADDDHLGGSPDHIFATPLASFSKSFLLCGVWMKKFRVILWKVILHSEDLSGSSCNFNLDSETVLRHENLNDAICCGGRRYSAVIYPTSWSFPDTLNSKRIICVSVVSLDHSIIYSGKHTVSGNDSHENSFSLLATGCSDGIVQLWKISSTQSTYSESECIPWDLVGTFAAHNGSVNAVSLSNCGSKIATMSIGGQNSMTTLHIWSAIYLIGGGSFLLEDVLSFKGPVVALKWLAVGNGKLLLGICMPNEFHIYTERRSENILVELESDKSKEMHSWCCIALSHSRHSWHDFLWGPKLTPVLLHENKISIFSEWLSETEYKHIGDSFIYNANIDCNFHHGPCIEKNIRGANELQLHDNQENGINLNVFSPEIFPQKKYSDTRNRFHNLRDIIERLCGSLGSYHPEALLQHLYTGNWKRAYAVLKHLVDSLKFQEASTSALEGFGSGKSCHIPQICLSKYLQGTTPTESGRNSNTLQWGQGNTFGSASFEKYVFQFGEDMKPTTFEEFSLTACPKSEIKLFIDTLENSYNSTALTDLERIHILTVLDILLELSNSSYNSLYESLDEPGRRFWVAVRFQHFCSLRKVKRAIAGEEYVVKSRLVAWAFQSDCQENLLNSVLSTEPSWLEMRNLGMGLWLTNVSQLRARMEKLARLQYLKQKNPKDCALLYLALNRLPVLAGLFKISKDEKDKVMFGFLSRNFQEEKNKAAALKNAYVLMGRHQLELAIAFFLLGGDPSSAVTVCAKNLGDEQLALVICRLLEGYGGPLEQHLILNILLPNAIDKGDNWLSSLLEWTLGNYSESIKRLFQTAVHSAVDESARKFSLFLFADIHIGRYCVILASKHSFKNAVGDYLASVLSKFAVILNSYSFNRVGLPLEALECFASSSVMESNAEGNSVDVETHTIFQGILNPFSTTATRTWLREDVACYLESNFRLSLAMQYISRLLREHPSWEYRNPIAFPELAKHDSLSDQEEHQTGEFRQKMSFVMLMFEQRYSMKLINLADMVLVFACNNGLLFLGYQLLQGIIFWEHEVDNPYNAGQTTLCPVVLGLLLKATKEVFCVYSRYIVCCHLSDSALKQLSSRSSTEENDGDSYFPRDFCLQSLICSLRIIRPLLKFYDHLLLEGLTLRTYSLLELIEYMMYFSHTWFHRNLRGLIRMVCHTYSASVSNHDSIEVMVGELMKLLLHTSESKTCDALKDAEIIQNSIIKNDQVKQIEYFAPSIPEDEMWQLIGTSLWIHHNNFTNQQLSQFLATENLESEKSMTDPNLFSIVVAKLTMASIAYVSSSLTKQLASFLRGKASKDLPVATFDWLEECNQHESSSLQHRIDQGISIMQLSSRVDSYAFIEKLWEISVSAKEICQKLLNERVYRFIYTGMKLPSSWKDFQKVQLAEHKFGASHHESEGNVSSRATNAAGSLFSKKKLDNDAFLETRRDSIPKLEKATFSNPKEIVKRSGELLEAICCNPIDEQQLAIASNRKGLLFSNWKTEPAHKEKALHIWSEADWPFDGWAGSDSAPIPTCVSPGIGLGSRSGAHLGLGGATIGLGSLARPRRDFTGGGAFGIPGYAGIGASSLGWGEQLEFEEFIDPPSTVENVRSRTLSSHPIRPFLLVGSCNTHIYLWEFGKDRATATYGVLPAANVPPPYALASISALEFDHCGHRFATAALDGTICTWQLEVGGRSNIHPTESSLCFNNHASDVAYVAASGSILAAAGCSTNGLNVVLWDTLAPPATSQASLMCHEGGARSLQVFDNDVGSGSISPIIITGGKNGDVGLHDFRYMVTGRSKRQRQPRDQDFKSSAAYDTSKPVENANGMIWYIPKAHLGSVTKIATVPNTSMFLTGSKDGDVKLWDAKRAQLVFHWQRIHDRHTFLQPNSRGIGGVVRAAVTDIQVFSHGFLTCGGDGSVKLVQLK